jgi:hypothetical protein
MKHRLTIELEIEGHQCMLNPPCAPKLESELGVVKKALGNLSARLIVDISYGMLEGSRFGEGWQATWQVKENVKGKG